MMVHTDKGHGHDQKYSLWRRECFPKISQRRDCYCSDLDWIEWRKGKPVALLECRRVIGSLKTIKDVVTHFISLNNGFQLELYARLSFELRIPAYLIIISDNAIDEVDYSKALFGIGKIIPPNVWPKGRMDVNQIEVIKVGIFNQEEYVQFLVDL